MRVLILGARAPAALEWARAFRQAGWRVSVADSLVMPLTRFSNSVDTFIPLPAPRQAPTAWADALARTITDQAIDLLLPTCEESFYLANYLPKLKALCRIAVMNFATLRQLHHKGEFATLTQGWPVTTPPTEMLSSIEQLERFSTTSTDWVFKPAFSRFAAYLLIRPSAEQLRQIRPTPEQPWIAQRFVAGQEHCSYSLLHEGRMTAHACYQPRYRVGQGAGIYFEPSDPVPIRNFVRHFGQATGYTGQVGFDFIEQPNGQFHVLECNPRATSGIHLFHDQPHGLVNALLGSGSGVLTPTQAPRMVALAMLLFAASRHGLSPTFWHDFLRAKDVIVKLGDLGPLFAQLPGVAEIAGKALQLRCSLLAATTADIEWDGQEIVEQEPA